jgi:hypothetical protein
MDGAFALDPNQLAHLVGTQQSLGTALEHLRMCQTAEDVLHYLPPVLQLSYQLTTWPPASDLGPVHEIYYKWVDTKPSAGYPNAFLRARDDVYAAGLQLFSAASTWPSAPHPAIPRDQGLQHTMAMVAAATGALNLLPHWKPTPEEERAEAENQKLHNELQLQAAEQERRETGVPAEYLPTDATGRIGRILAGLDGLKAALYSLESVHEPEAICDHVAVLLIAANAIGQGPESSACDPLQATIDRWPDAPPDANPAPWADARHGLVQLGWALVQAVQHDAMRSRGQEDPADTPQTDQALDALAMEAADAYARVVAR